MAFTVVFDILKINKVHRRTSTTSVVWRQKVCVCVSTMLKSLFYRICIPVLCADGTRYLPRGSGRYTCMERNRGRIRSRDENGVEREEGNVSTGMMHEHNTIP